MKPMTPRQSWAIFCLTKMDVRHASISLEKASQLIDSLKQGSEQFDAAVAELGTIPGVQTKGAPAKPKRDWQLVYNEAHAAGMEAGRAIIPCPMVVVGHANPMDDSSPVTDRYVVPEGPCGFAWVTVRPGNCSFALWAKKQGLARIGYGGGMQFWVGEFNQSMTRKEAYAHAFADALRKHDIEAYASSRLD